MALAHHNTALVFVFPEAALETVDYLFEAQLRDAQLGVLRRGTVFTEVIERSGIVARHYGRVARFATEVQPESIHLSDAAKDRFRQAFHTTWEEAVETGLVISAARGVELCKGAAALAAAWAVANRIDLGDGIVVGRLRSFNACVINGQYPRDRERLTTPGGRILWYLVSWEETHMPWETFNETIIGGEDPQRRVKSSFRASIAAEWKGLGLQAPPSTGDAGVYASNGPLRAVLDQHIWLEEDITTLPFTRAVVAAGGSVSLISGLMSDPNEIIDERSAPIFEHMRGRQTSDACRVLARLDVEKNAMPSVNTAVLIINPHAACHAVRSVVETHLLANRVRIVREGHIPTNVVAADRIVERLFGVAATYAMEETTEAIPLTEAARGHFKRLYGTTWDVVVQSGMVITAKKALETLPHPSPSYRAKLMDPAALHDRWHESKVHELDTGIRVALLEKENRFVINGDYPLEHVRYTTPGRKVMWFVVEWHERQHSWATIISEVLGRSPEDAAENTLHRAIADSWRSLGLGEPPTARNVPFTFSHGPLHAMHERRVWLKERLSTDPLVRLATDRGLRSLAILRHWLENPTVVLEGAEGRAVFRHFEGAQSSAFVTALITHERIAASGGGGRNPNDGGGHGVNHAVLVALPHANTPAVRNLIEAVLRHHGITVDAEVSWPSGKLEQSKVIDELFHPASRYAMECSPNELVLTAEGSRKFESAFGIPWDVAKRRSLIRNSHTAMMELGLITPSHLMRKWKKAAPHVEVEESLLVGYFSSEKTYVVNGHYPLLRSRFHAAGAVCHAWKVSWQESKLSWEAVVQRVVGDAMGASGGTIEGSLRKDWEALGIETPTANDPCVMFSRGPLEAIRERKLWFREKTTSDPFSIRLQADGMGIKFVDRLLTNPLSPQGGTLASVFRQTAAKDSTAALFRASVLHEEPRGVLAENVALIFIKPHAMSTAMVETLPALLPPAVKIIHEGRIGGGEVRVRNIADRTFATAMKFAILTRPADITEIDDAAKLTFNATFGVSWEQALGHRKLRNAAEAARTLQGGAQALMEMWNRAEAITLARGLHVAYLEEIDLYVINGYYQTMKQEYDDGNGVQFFVVKWSNHQMSWREFLEKVVGTSTPKRAAVGSIRRYVWDQWKTLGLRHEPSKLLNIVHASHGPLQALAERRIWLGTRHDDDVFSRALLDLGMSSESLEHWETNPFCIVGGSAGRAFDLTMQISASDTADFMLEVEPEKAMDRAPPPPSSLETAMQNVAFVFLKPNAATEGAITLAEVMFREHNLSIDRQGDAYAAELLDNGIIDRHYRTVATCARWDVDAIHALPDSVLRRFHDKFGQSLFRLAEDGLVVGAFEAIERLDFTPTQLYASWRRSTMRLKLAVGCYVGYLPEEGYYVLNGFYPLMRSLYADVGSKLHWFVVSWPESRMTWSDFRINVAGASDPAQALPDSIRGMIYVQWKSLGLAQAPTIIDNVLHVSASPLEAAAERINFLQLPAPDDPFARLAIQRGVSIDTLTEWFQNGSVTLANQVTTSFDASEDRPTSEVLRMIGIYEHEKKLRPMVNMGFLFIKPHAATPMVENMVATSLAQCGFRVVEHGVITSDDILRDGIIDRHFGRIAQFAVVIPPKEVTMSEASRRTFWQFSGLVWDDALQEGLIVNASEAMERLSVSATELAAMWVAVGRIHSLEPGMQITQLKHLYVVNGYYPSIRQRFMVEGARIIYSVVTWLESQMSWEDFKSKFIGHTDPRLATSQSLRGIMYDQWKSLGLTSRPDAIDNGVHASASPLEAMAARRNWLGRRIEMDPLTAPLTRVGLSIEVINELLEDPLIVYQRVQAPAFEHFRHKQTTDFVQAIAAYCDEEASTLATEMLRNAHREEELKKRQQMITTMESQLRIQSLNRAVLILHPSLNTPLVQQMVDRVLHLHAIFVENDGVISGADVLARQCYDKQHFLASRYALEVHPRDMTLTEEQSARFRDYFGVSWASMIECDAIINAADALKALGRISPEVLFARRDPEGKELALFPGAVVTYFMEDELYIVNVEFLYRRSLYVEAGARTRYYSLSWGEAAMSFATFLSTVVGDGTAGATADPRSIWGALRRDYAALGLPRGPIESGAVYVSASPLESVMDRYAWCRGELETDPFTRAALLAGANIEMAMQWVQNAYVWVHDTSDFAFVLARGKDASVVANLIADSAAEALFDPRRRTKRIAKSSATSPLKVLWGREGGDNERDQLRELFGSINHLSTPEDLKVLFDRYHPKNGRIRRELFKRDYENFETYGRPLDPKRIAESFERYDTRRDGSMTFQEFSILMLARVRL